MAAPEDFDEKVRAFTVLRDLHNDVRREDAVSTAGVSARAPKPLQDVLTGNPYEQEPARYDFLRLGEEIAKSLVETAEAQVTQAENMLKHTQAFAENVRAQITEKQRELAEMNERLRTFGATILDAHNRFHSNSTPDRKVS